MSYTSRLIVLLILPAILSIGVIALLINSKASSLAHGQIAKLESSLMEAKKAELKYYIALASNSIAHLYANDGPNPDQAKEEARRILQHMSYGPDGYFFVYDYSGRNIMHPRQAHRVGKNWWDLKDNKGNYVIQDLISAAKAGGGYTSYVWEKPSTGKLQSKIGYAIGLDKWKWMIGTGLYTSDIETSVVKLRNEIEGDVTRTFVLITAIMLGCMALVVALGAVLSFREHRISNNWLRSFNRRVLEAQEDERGRLARELHDGISQLLSSIKFTLELAGMQARDDKATAGQTIDKGITGLASAITEVRRISHDLRPGILDDLGLAPALSNLCEEFSDRTGIKTQCQAQPVGNALPDLSKIALYRIAQEALTNVERHSKADLVKLTLQREKSNIRLIVADNGKGMAPGISRPESRIGIGMKNIQERVSLCNGRMNVSSGNAGTSLTVALPVVDQNAETAQPADIRAGTSTVPAGE